MTATEYLKFIKDKVNPQLGHLYELFYRVPINEDDIKIALRYLAHEILLFLGDPLPDSAEPE